MSKGAPIAVLVVDDDAAVADFLRQVIEEMGIVDRVDVACSVDEALERISSGRYAVVLLDLVFGGEFNGPGLARRSRDRNKDALIIVITGHPTKLFSRELIDIPIDDFLFKPVQVARLQATLVRACTKYRHRAQLTKCLEEKHRYYQRALQRLRQLELTARSHLVAPKDDRRV